MYTEAGERLGAEIRLEGIGILANTVEINRNLWDIHGREQEPIGLPRSGSYREWRRMASREYRAA